MESDRISKLPDFILHRILSCPCLMARDPVLYSSLSKRWRYLWKSIPFLYFEDGVFLLEENGIYEKEGDHVTNFFRNLHLDEAPSKSKGSFAQFVDSLLLLRNNSDLYSFRLQWWIDLHPDGQHHLNLWLQHVVRRKVKVIDLDFYKQQMDVVLPYCIFSCQSLEELKMRFGKTVIMGLPKVVGLDRLRKLHLCFVQFDAPSMDKLVNGCPVLDELTIEESLLVSVNIAFCALRNLAIERCVIVGATFQVACPFLLSCHLIGNYISVQEVSLENLSCVGRTSIHTDYDLDLTFHKNDINFYRRNSNAEAPKMISPKIENEQLEEFFGPQMEVPHGSSDTGTCKKSESTSYVGSDPTYSTEVRERVRSLQHNVERLKRKLGIFIQICPEYTDALFAVMDESVESRIKGKSNTLSDNLQDRKQTLTASSSSGLSCTYQERFLECLIEIYERMQEFTIEKCPREKLVILEQRYATECGALEAGTSQASMPDADNPDV